MNEDIASQPLSRPGQPWRNGMNLTDAAEQLQEWYIEALTSGYSVNNIWLHVAKNLMGAME